MPESPLCITWFVAEKEAKHLLVKKIRRIKVDAHVGPIMELWVHLWVLQRLTCILIVISIITLLKLLTTAHSSNLITLGWWGIGCALRRVAMGLESLLKSCCPNSFPKGENEGQCTCILALGERQSDAHNLPLQMSLRSGPCSQQAQVSQSPPGKPRPVPLVPGGAVRLRWRPRPGEPRGEVDAGS